MQCRSCDTTLPNGATVCPNCQTATPYNAATSSSEETNPYEDSALSPIASVLVAPTSSDASEQKPAGQEKQEALLLALPLDASNTDSPASPSLHVQPVSYQQATLEPSMLQAQAIPSQPYIPARPGPPLVDISTSAPISRSNKSFLWLSLLIVAMILIVTGLVLAPVLHGWHPLTGPSGNSIYADAHAIISDTYTANVDTNAQTVTPATSFKINTQFYMVLTVDPSRYDFVNRNGYFIGSFYLNNQPVGETQPQMFQMITQVYPLQFPQPGKVTLEVYWCTVSTCDDQRLARYVSFTIIN